MTSVGLLPFHKTILSDIHDPQTSDLLLLARGLGLRKLICSLLQIYDSSQSLILLINSSQDEEAGIGEELGIMGCRRPGLRVVGYETPRKDRQNLYKKGGLISITSRILVVDMLQSEIPTELITGMLVMHAEKVTPLSLEAFIIRLYREKNQTGFLKAFSDQPEYITSGMSPLKNIMKELQVRRVHIYPRFHDEIKKSLERRKADVIELHQPLTASMTDIHHAIVQCMTGTLAELKRSNAALDLDDFSVENAYFRSFDSIVRRQLDPVWHRVGPKTKQFIGDLGTLRQLLAYLLSYDALSFHAYLETILASTSGSYPLQNQNRSLWLSSDVAQILFETAKRRCYIRSGMTNKVAATDVSADDEDWNVLDEIEGPSALGQVQGKEMRHTWLPKTITPVLEELPKWSLLADILQEIEEEIISRPASVLSPGSDTVLVMVSSNRTCVMLREYLSTMDRSSPNPGRKMMEERLKNYLSWKGNLSTSGQPLEKVTDISKTPNTVTGEMTEAMKRKDAAKAGRGVNRRRVRGGAASTTTKRPAQESSHGGLVVKEQVEMRDEAEEISDFLSTQPLTLISECDMPPTLIRPSDQETLTSKFSELDFDQHYGLLKQEQTVLIRAYSDDTDDQVLAEIRPRYIVMFEPNQDFVRRIEVYRSSHPGLGVRVYFMMYQLSCEEHKYLAGLRREKESFEKLIKERGSMLLPILEQREGSHSRTDAIIRTISSRVAGGGKIVNKEPPQVIVDMREFRSSLPSLLHATNLLVIPATLTVGDYILTPDMCVERKSVHDLVTSFINGRLYTQCELMSVHYKQPVLLIEFEENKSFSLQTLTETKTGAQSSGKYPRKAMPLPGSDEDKISDSTVQSKLVLLTLAFPRLRIIWSSSPHATAEIFSDLKLHNSEPDPSKAILVGAEEDEDSGVGINSQAEDLLRCFPGINAKNAKFVMSKVGSVREFCELGLPQVQEILGIEPGKICYDFLHHIPKNR